MKRVISGLVLWCMSGIEGHKPISCHIFCTVIDNYGDLGVCWRLARHLAQDQGLTVTLMVDDLTSFQHLAPGIDPSAASQMLGKLCIRHWQGDALSVAPADLVIEGFACDLPASYIKAMAAERTAPLWINLEYLSAESWVDGCHGLSSIHPSTGLTKYFWFPGFTASTGGLLRSQQEITGLLGVSPAGRSSVRHMSLFSYEQAALADLLDALAADTQPTVLSVFTGRALPDVARWLGRDLAIGDIVERGSLSIKVLSLLDHADYDQLLARCDLNLIRGEDSFVRAQWAGEAMLWHIYPQEEDAHLIKLAAWQQRVETVAAAAGTPMPMSWSQALQAWNNAGEATSSQRQPNWPQFLADLPAIRQAMQSWRDHLLAQPDLATQLMRFYADRVESRPK